jgi:hypothetical protein
VQCGEAEVTNPLSGALPEVFSIVPAPDGGAQVIRQRFSSLSPEPPLMSPAEVQHLERMKVEVRVRFVIERAGRTSNRGDDGSPLPDASVVRCTTDAVGIQFFPRPLDDTEDATMNGLPHLWLSVE